MDREFPDLVLGQRKQRQQGLIEEWPADLTLFSRERKFARNTLAGCHLIQHFLSKDCFFLAVLRTSINLMNGIRLDIVLTHLLVFPYQPVQSIPLACPKYNDAY